MNKKDLPGAASEMKNVFAYLASSAAALAVRSTTKDETISRVTYLAKKSIEKAAGKTGWVLPAASFTYYMIMRLGEKMGGSYRGINMPHRDVNTEIRDLFEDITKEVGKEDIKDLMRGELFDLEKLKNFLEKHRDIAKRLVVKEGDEEINRNVEIVRMTNGEFVLIANGIKSHAGRESEQVWVNREDLELLTEQIIQNHNLLEDDAKTAATAEMAALEAIVLHEKRERDVLFEKSRARLGAPGYRLSDRAVIAWLEGATEEEFARRGISDKERAELADLVRLSALDYNSMLDEAHNAAVADEFEYIEQRVNAERIDGTLTFKQMSEDEYNISLKELDITLNADRRGEEALKKAERTVLLARNVSGEEAALLYGKASDLYSDAARNALKLSRISGEVEYVGNLVPELVKAADHFARASTYATMAADRYGAFLYASRAAYFYAEAARYLVKQGEKIKAAPYFAKAAYLAALASDDSEPGYAGVLLRTAADYYKEAARIYEDKALIAVEPLDSIVSGIVAADHYTRAAEVLLKYGDKAEAARAHEKAGDRFAEAMKITEKNEPMDIAASFYSAKASEAYEKAGRSYAALAAETGEKGDNIAISKEAAGYFTVAGALYDKASLFTLVPELKRKSDLLARSAEALVSAAEKSRIAADTGGELASLAKAAASYNKASTAAYVFDRTLAYDLLYSARYYFSEAKRREDMAGTEWVPEAEDDSAIVAEEFAVEMGENLIKQAEAGLTFEDTVDLYSKASKYFTKASEYARERGDAGRSGEYFAKAKELEAKAGKTPEEHAAEIDAQVDLRYDQAFIKSDGFYFAPLVNETESTFTDKPLRLAASQQFNIDSKGISDTEPGEQKRAEEMVRAFTALMEEARKQNKAVPVPGNVMARTEELLKDMLEKIVENDYDGTYFYDAMGEDGKIDKKKQEEEKKRIEGICRLWLDQRKGMPLAVPFEIYLSGDLEKIEIPGEGIKNFRMGEGFSALSYPETMEDGTEKIVVIINSGRGKFRDYFEKNEFFDPVEAFAMTLRQEFLESKGWIAHRYIKHLEMAVNGFNAATEINKMLLYHRLLDRFRSETGLGFEKTHPYDPRMRNEKGETLEHGYLYEEAINLMKFWAKRVSDAVAVAKRMGLKDSETQIVIKTSRGEERISDINKWINDKLAKGFIYSMGISGIEKEERVDVPSDIRAATMYVIENILKKALLRVALDEEDRGNIEKVTERARYLIEEYDVRTAFMILVPLMNGDFEGAYKLSEELMPQAKMAINLAGEELPHETAGGIEGVNDRIRGLFERVRKELGNADYAGHAGYVAELEGARISTDRYGNPVYDLAKFKVLLEKTALLELADVEVREVDGELVVIANGIISHVGRESGQVWINQGDIDDKIQTLMAGEGLKEKEAKNVAVRSIILHEKVERNTLLDRARKKMKVENPKSATTPDAVVEWLDAIKDSEYYNSMVREAQTEAEKAEVKGTGIMLAADSCRALVEESRPGVQPGIILIPVVADEIRYIENRGQYEALVNGAWRALKKDYGVNIKAIYYRVDLKKEEKIREENRKNLRIALEGVIADSNFIKYDLSRVLVYTDSSLDINKAKEVVKKVLGDKFIGKLAGVVEGEFTLEAQERFSIVSLVVLGLGIMDWHRAESTGRYTGDIEKRIKDLFVRMVENPQEYRGMDAKELVKRLQDGLLIMKIKKINYEEIREFMETESAVLESL
jgi:hypothetical protein